VTVVPEITHLPSLSQTAIRNASSRPDIVCEGNRVMQTSLVTLSSPEFGLVIQVLMNIRII
jgi:hypothetical protein